MSRMNIYASNNKFVSPMKNYESNQYLWANFEGVNSEELHPEPIKTLNTCNILMNTNFLVPYKFNKVSKGIKWVMRGPIIMDIV